MLESQIIINKKEKLPNIHPGEILKEEFLEALNISVGSLAKETDISEAIISKIVRGKQSIETNTANKFSKFFGTSVEFWLNLQKLYDSEEENNKKIVYGHL